MKPIRNKIKQVVRTPLYRQRVVEDKTKYTRKGKNKFNTIYNIE